VTAFQMLAVGSLAAVAFFTYVLPNIPAYTSAAVGSRLDTLSAVRNIVAIRDSTQDKKVADACNELLQAILQVGS